MTYDEFHEVFFDMKYPFAGLYQMNLNGEFKSYPRNRALGPEIPRIHRGRMLKTRLNNKGYWVVALTDINGNDKSCTVHRLIALNYIPNPENHPLVRHLDDNPINNDLMNLSWGTYQQNRIDAFVNGYVAPKGKDHPSWGKRGRIFKSRGNKGGANSPRSKIVLDTQTGIFYDCTNEAAKAKGINGNTLRSKLAGFYKNNTSLIYA